MTLEARTLAVNTIKEGTVIDHIPAGQSFAIVKLLRLSKHPKTISIGINLPSTQMGKKDIIKVEQRELTPDEANCVALFAPEATISIIRDFKLVNKFQVSVPEVLEGAAGCPNKQCITNHETMTTSFRISVGRSNFQLCCKYCCKGFTQDEIHI